MRKAWLVGDDKYPDISVTFKRPDLPDEIEVEIAEDEARLIRRFQKLEAQYDALVNSLWDKAKRAKRVRSGRA